MHGPADEELVTAERELRFGFGENWSQFLAIVDEKRIAVAAVSLQDMLGQDSLVGQRFLDVGSGSGLFSLAAHRLGAQVRSFDYDPQSVACTEEMRSRFGDAEGPAWEVERASVLDADRMQAIGRFDVVYSWGVLHHTGAMWDALAHASAAVDEGGTLFISIYNDQGPASRRWHRIKRTYNRSGQAGRTALIAAVGGYFVARKILKELLGGRIPSPQRISDQKRDRDRGMSIWYDVRDWVGGFPFEVAKPEEIVAFLRDRGFLLIRLRTVGGRHGCNEYVFQRST